MSGLPFRIPPEARLHIRGVEHLLVEATRVGWVLEVVGQPGVRRTFTVEQMRRESLEPDFRLDPHGGRPGWAEARSEAGADADGLGDVPKSERSGILSRKGQVKRFLALEAAGR